MPTITKKSAKQSASDEAKVVLLKMLKPGTEVYAIVKRVSSSGMSRRIAVLAVVKGKIENITGWVASLLSLKWNDDNSLTVGGAGMDMGFHVVYSTSRALWPDGYECTGDGCKSNDHSNGMTHGQGRHCAVCGAYVEGAAHHLSHGRPVCSKECAGKPLPVHGDSGYALIHRGL